MPMTKEAGAKQWLARWPAWVERAKAKHNNKYSYLKTEKDDEGKIEIVCPAHGTFKQTPQKHVYGRGCPKCGTFRRGKASGATGSPAPTN